MLDQQIRNTIHWQRTHLPNISSIVQLPCRNHFIEFKRFIYELERGN